MYTINLKRCITTVREHKSFLFTLHCTNTILSKQQSHTNNRILSIHPYSQHQRPYNMPNFPPTHHCHQSPQHTHRSKKQATFSDPMTIKQPNQTAQPIKTHKSLDPTTKSHPQHLTGEEHTK